jgi:beta-barrel assembly-enhancing protease
MNKFRPRLLLAAALACAMPTPPLVAQTAPAVRLPSLGDASSEDFSVGTERRLGEQIMAEIRRDPAYLDDPLLLGYVQALWAPLVAAARGRGNIGPDLDEAFAFEAFLVRDRSVNAFALPGGFVGVHLGLVAMTGTPDELASVLAHELSHVTQRHIARGLASSSRQSLVGVAAMLLGVLAAARSSSPDVAQAAIVGGQAAMIQGQLNFSRDMEREADRIGWVVHQDAGFAPQGMASMFERLDAANRLTDNGAFPYLRSHPLTIDRIGEAKARVHAVPGGDGPAPRPPLDHLLMQARSRVLMDPSVQSLRRIQSQDAAGAAGPERVAALYGSALASLELREPSQAQSALDAARSLAATSAPAASRAGLVLGLLQAQVWVATGQPDRALAWFDAQSGMGPGAARPLLLARAQAALAGGRDGRGATQALRASVEALQTWVAEHKGDAVAWSALAQAAQAQGLALRSLRAQAEAQAAGGDLVGAIDRLRAAQRQARSGAVAADFIESSIIDSRLRDLTARRRAQIAEARGARGGTGNPGGDAGDDTRAP